MSQPPQQPSPASRRANAVAVVEPAPTTLATTDYADAFQIGKPASDARGAEQWIRAVFEHTPWVLRQGLPVVWRTVLDFRLGPRPSPHHVLGMPIMSCAPEVIHLDVPSSLFTFHIVLRVQTTRVLLTTFLHYRKPRLAPAIWTIAAPIHRQIGRYLLTHAATDQQS